MMSLHANLKNYIFFCHLQYWHSACTLYVTSRFTMHTDFNFHILEVVLKAIQNKNSFSNMKKNAAFLQN